MNKNRILVAGGAGYIGSHTTVELQNAGFDVVIVDNFSNSTPDVIHGIEEITGKTVPYVTADCTDLAALNEVFEAYPDIVGIINFAASKAVNESVHKPLLYYRNNLVTLLNLMDCMNNHGIKGLVFSSSCTVYGEPDTNPVDENAPIKKATSPYGNTKQISEEIIADSIYAGAKINAVVLRYFNPVGAHPSALIGELPGGVPQNLIPYLTQTAIGIRQELKVFGTDYPTPDGSCIRDFIDVVDLARAHVKAIERAVSTETTGHIDYFNLGTGNGVSVIELINTFESATGVKVPHSFAPRREGDIIKVWANPTKANNELGWRATTPLSQTMANAWKWQLHLREKGIM